MDGLKATVKSLSAEKTLYLAILSCAAISSVIHIAVESGAEPIGYGENRDLGPGWRWMNKRQDIADFEWTFWLSNLREYALLALFGHAAISLLATQFFPLFKPLLQSIFCIHCLRAIFGIPYVLLIVAHCTAFYAATLARSAKVCWIITVANVLFLHIDASMSSILISFFDCTSTLKPLVYAGSAFTALRCCSFALEKIKVRQSNDDQDRNLFELLQYNFYLPYFFFGPVMTYDVFEKKNASIPTKANLLRLGKKTLKTVGVVVAVDLLLHFLHISSLAADVEFLHLAPAHVVGFLLFANVLLDWGKAWILYRLTSEVCIVVDGYGNAPKGPKCLANLCAFADTFFDRGIQHWVCRYIYDPMGLSHTDVTKEATAAALTFLFVFAWQGPCYQVLVWACLNWFGLAFEFFVWKKCPQGIKENWRVAAFVLGINYWCILIFNAVGINGVETARESSTVLFFGGNWWNTAVALLLSYCYVALITHGTDVKPKKE